MAVWICFLVCFLFLTGCGQSSLDEDLSRWLSSSVVEGGAEDNMSLTEDKTDHLDGYFPDSTCSYAYDTLSEAQKLWYRDMVDILGSMSQERELSGEGIARGLDEESVDHIFQCVMLDHPEFFYVEGYTYTQTTRRDKLLSISFSGTYQGDPETVKEKWERIQERVTDILAGVPAGTDDYGKIKYVYETLITITEYDLEASDNQNIYSVFVGGTSVCQGYAKATQYLLQKLGVECTLVQGSVQGGAKHGWNLVKADGEYYYVDTTWGDSSYQPIADEEMGRMPQINYDYLCVTTQEMEKTHVLENCIELPLCTATKDNYYVREGFFYQSMDEAGIRNQIALADPTQGYFITLKCASPECYREIHQALIEDGGIFDYYPMEAGGIAYIENEAQYSMSFWVTND